MNTWKIILAVLVIFGAGVITGGMLVIHSKTVTRAESRPGAGDLARPAATATNATRPYRLPTPFAPPLRKGFLPQLDQELKLTPEQRQRIESILAIGQDRTKQLWFEIEPEVHEVLMDTKDRIRAELTPEQKAQFEQLLKPKPRQPASTNAPASTLPTAPAPR